MFKSRCLTPRQLNLFAAVSAAAHVPGNIIGIGKTARRSEPSKYAQFQSGAYKPESDDSTVAPYHILKHLLNSIISTLRKGASPELKCPPNLIQGKLFLSGLLDK